MIEKNDFFKIKEEIEIAVEEAFKFARLKEKNENDYILFLSRSSYNSKIDKKRFSPWTIDNKGIEIFDRHRVEFLLLYLNQQYNFQKEYSEDSKYSISMELMIYSHIWESKHNLSKLKRLADLCASDNYDWDLKIPEDSKYNFIRDSIRGVFKKHNLKIYDVINECYKSQLRNAFSHSLYNFGLNMNSIYLENFDNKHYKIEKLSFDEWTRIFLKSALLQNIFHNKFTNEIEELNRGEIYNVKMEYNGFNKKGLITYNHDSKRFEGQFL